VKKKHHRAKLIQHLVQPFDLPFPGYGRTFLSSGFCESDESTTIFRRTVFEGESDVCEVECSLCGNQVITYRDSNSISSSYSPEIVGCLIQRGKTLQFVVEKSLSQSDSKTVAGVILKYLARHDFTKSFLRISVYLSGVSSNLLKKQPPKSDLLFSQKLKSTSGKSVLELNDQESEELECKKEQEEDGKQRVLLADSARKLLVEQPTLFMHPNPEREKISFKQTQNLQRTSKNSSEKLLKAEGTSLRKQIRDFSMKDSLYD
jgi:hypothetical protein